MTILWTIEARDGTTSTLCEDHALPALNAALMGVGLSPAPSMVQAAMVFDLVRAMHGDRSEAISSSEEGSCPQCQIEQAQQRGMTA